MIPSKRSKNFEQQHNVQNFSFNFLFARIDLITIISQKDPVKLISFL